MGGRASPAVRADEDVHNPSADGLRYVSEAGVRKNQIFSFLRGSCNGRSCGRGSVRIGGGSCFLVVLLVCQPECPEREDVACAVFYIVFHDIAVGNLMDLFFPLVLSAHLECRSVDFKVADT